jgi:hypothetical protein
MKVKTEALTGAGLDWAVATALAHGKQWPWGISVFQGRVLLTPRGKFSEFRRPRYSRDGALSQPIIEQERICVNAYPDPADGWSAHYSDGVKRHHLNGPTQLVSALRCFVSKKLGDVVDLPDDIRE